MLKKSECETAIRELCHKFAEDKGFTPRPDYDPGFITFVNWVNQKGYSQYLNFRSVAGPQYDAEMWFDEEMKQKGRN
jgi:hypothetical protein